MDIPLDCEEHVGLSIKAFNSNVNYRLYRIPIDKSAIDLFRELIESILRNNLGSFTAKHKIIYLTEHEILALRPVNDEENQRHAKSTRIFNLIERIKSLQVCIHIHFVKATIDDHMTHQKFDMQNIFTLPFFCVTRMPSIYIHFFLTFFNQKPHAHIFL